MAINKSHTSPLMKTMILLLAGTFVLSIGFAGIATIPSCGAGPLLPQPRSTGTPAASTETTAQIAATFGPVVNAQEASLTVNPKNYDLLVAQGNTYLEWANAVAQTSQEDLTPSLPLWGKAVGYYKRAVDIKATDAVVLGDYGISLYFSGDTTAAISAGEKSRAIDPRLAPNVFFLGEYYATAGDTAKALDAFQAYLALEPNGTYAANAQQAIKDLGGQ